MQSNKEPWIAPGSQTAAGGNRVGAELAGADGPANPAFNCQFCERTFSTKIGVGVHVSSAHRAEANDQIVVERKKSRWPDEENRLLALSEAKLVFDGVSSSVISKRA